MNKQTEKKFLKFKLLRGDVDVQTCRNENSSDSLHPKLKFREIDANAIGPEMHSRFLKGVVIHHPLRATTTQIRNVTGASSSRLLGSLSHLPSLPLQTPDALLVPLGAHLPRKVFFKSFNPSNFSS